MIKDCDMSDPRWDDIDSIYDRLNAPILFDFFIYKNITYKHILPGYTRPTTAVIKEKFGDCDDLAYFGKVVLSRAGYEVFGRIYDKGGNIVNHIILGVKLEDGSYLKAVDFNKRGNSMSGPYNTLLELDRAAGFGRWYSKRGPFFFDM